MTKKLKVFLSTFTLVVLLVLASTVSSRPTEAIILEGADESRTMGITSSSTLINLIQQVAPRFVIRYANQTRVVDIGGLPEELDTLLEQITERFVLRYANQNQFYELIPPLMV